MTPMRVTPEERDMILARRAETVKINPETENPLLAEVRKAAANSFTARTEYCPHCQPIVKLNSIKLDAVFARKGCAGCKRRFTYIRSDTPEGRAARAKEWRRSQATGDYASFGVDAEGVVK